MSITSFKPELLSPAGNLDKLQVAVNYGADAVYLAGQKFGLRTAADNFTPDELEEGMAYAHQHGAKVFVVINGFLHDSDIDELPEFLHLIHELKADAIIASDLGVIETVKKELNSKSLQMPVHLSTQASCINRYSAKLWKKMGVQRLIFGRETSIEAAGKIKKDLDLEVELFIHGSMCMAFSGHCTISNYTQGRDSNRGGCSQSCRFKYSLDLGEQKTIPHTSFMSSKDLNGLELLPYFFEHKIDSLKIEGRMRSPLYAASVSRVYREAIDAYSKDKSFNSTQIQEWQKELNYLPHRSYTEASLLEPASEMSVHLQSDQNRTEPKFLGLVRKVHHNDYALVEVKSSFTAQDSLEVMSKQGSHYALPKAVFASTGEKLEKINPNTLIRIPYIEGITQGQILRKQGVQ